MKVKSIKINKQLNKKSKKKPIKKAIKIEIRPKVKPKVKTKVKPKALIPLAIDLKKNNNIIHKTMIRPIYKQMQIFNLNRPNNCYCLNYFSGNITENKFNCIKPLQTQDDILYAIIIDCNKIIKKMLLDALKEEYSYRQLFQPKLSYKNYVKLILQEYSDWYDFLLFLPVKDYLIFLQHKKNYKQCILKFYKHLDQAYLNKFITDKICINPLIKCWYDTLELRKCYNWTLNVLHLPNIPFFNNWEQYLEDILIRRTNVVNRDYTSIVKNTTVNFSDKLKMK